MTLKQNSKNSLKAWVNKIKRYEVELPMLYQKLEYLEVKSIGYNSPSFEPRLSSNGSASFKGIDYWLEKIDACESKIKQYQDEIRKFRLFRASLSMVDRIILDDYLDNRRPVKEVVESAGIKKYYLYQRIEKLNQLVYKEIK